MRNLEKDESRLRTQRPRLCRLQKEAQCVPSGIVLVKALSLSGFGMKAWDETRDEGKRTLRIA